MKVIKLQTLTMAYTNEIEHKLYKWELSWIHDGGGYTLTCYQPFDDPRGLVPRRWGSVGTWNYSTLKIHYSDMLFIDFGQRWYVKGMIRLLREVKDILFPVDTLKIKLKIHGNDYTLFDIEESAKVYIGTDAAHKMLFSPETVLALVDKIKDTEYAAMQTAKNEEEYYQGGM